MLEPAVQELRVQALEAMLELGRLDDRAAFAEHEDPFNYAVVALEHVEAAVGEPELAALLAQARDTFERLGAMPWLGRVRALQHEGAAA